MYDEANFEILQLSDDEDGPLPAWKFKWQKLAVETNGCVVDTHDVNVMSLIPRIPRDTLLTLFDAYRLDRLPLPEPVHIGTILDRRLCRYCARKPEFTCDGLTVRNINACPTPEGAELQYDITFRSGTIVANGGLGVYHADRGEAFRSMTAVGQAEYHKRLAAIGCASGPIGNNTPGLYRLDGDRYVIASPGYDADDNRLPFEGERLGTIVTDCGVYEIADLADFTAKGGKPKVDGPGFLDVVADIRPGTYRFSHYTFRRDFAWDVFDKPTVYAEFRWTGPVVD